MGNLVRCSHSKQGTAFARCTVMNMSNQCSQSYRSELDTWVKKAEHNYGTSLGGLRSALSSDIPDDALYQLALATQRAYEQPSSSTPKDEWINAEVIQYDDGVVYALNPVSGKVYARLIPHGNGFAFIGPQSWNTRLNGRSEFVEFANRLYGKQNDRNWLYEKK